MARSHLTGTVLDGIVAGAAGGFAEVLWVLLYAAVTGGNAASIARGVTTAAGIGALLPSTSTALGILIHMALALTLGVALAFAWRTISPRGTSRVQSYALTIPALACVWTINFFILLPVISPEFVHMLPYTASLLSKLLFGFAVAEVLLRCSAERRQVVQAVR
jgi:hypothetical protein